MSMERSEISQEKPRSEKKRLANGQDRPKIKQDGFNIIFKEIKKHGTDRYEWIKAELGKTSHFNPTRIRRAITVAEYMVNKDLKTLSPNDIRDISVLPYTPDQPYIERVFGYYLYWVKQEAEKELKMAEEVKKRQEASAGERKQQISEEMEKASKMSERESLDLRGIKLPTLDEQARLHEIELCEAAKKVYAMLMDILNCTDASNITVWEAIRTKHFFDLFDLPFDPIAGCLLSHLQFEIPELKKIKSWSELIVGDSDIYPHLDLLKYRAEIGHFEGICAKCRTSG